MRTWWLALVLAGCGSIPVVFPPSSDAGTRACGERQPCAAPFTCDLARGECVECLTDAQCAGALPACDPATNRCVECRGTLGCAAPLVCSGATPTCVQACQDGQPNTCAGFAEGCRAGICAACLEDEDCGPNRRCDVTVGRCVGCLVDAHCGGATPRCEQSTGLCRACVVNADCASTDSCFQGACR